MKHEVGVRQQLEQAEILDVAYGRCPAGAHAGDPIGTIGRQASLLHGPPSGPSVPENLATVTVPRRGARTSFPP